jgi:hypothetical protein
MNSQFAANYLEMLKVIIIAILVAITFRMLRCGTQFMQCVSHYCSPYPICHFETGSTLIVIVAHNRSTIISYFIPLLEEVHKLLHLCVIVQQYCFEKAKPYAKLLVKKEFDTHFLSDSFS